MSHTLRKLAMNIGFILRGHILNPLWLPHDRRTKRRKESRVKARMFYLRRFRKFVAEMKPSALTTPAPEPDKPEHLFTLWLQGEEKAPPIVKACLGSMRRHVDLPLVVLDENTIFDWIKLPDHIMDKWRKGLITPTHFSDICRVELLYRHGGVWADTTDYFTAPIPPFIMKEDFFLFMSGYNLKISSHTFIQSCFIRARKEDPLLGMWRELLFKYWEEEDSLVDYFTLHFLLRFLVENNREAAKLFAGMPEIDQDPTHLILHKYKDQPYSPELFREATKDTFFQKTTYKLNKRKHGRLTPVPGSIWEYILSH